MALPNLSGLRPAAAPTGPYVDVLSDDASCPLSLNEFSPGHSMALRGAGLVQHKLGLRRADEYRSRVGCDKAWRPLTYETEKRTVDGQERDVKTGRLLLEQEHYDTVELGIWLLENNFSPSTRREFVDEDRNACIAKAMELVESQGWASLTAYKEHFFPTPPPPPQAVPSPAEAALNPSPALRQEHSDEFIFYGKSRLDHLIYRPWSSPLHYSKLLNLVHLSAGESGRVLPLSVDTPGAVELAQGIQQLEGAVTGQHWARGCNKFMALVYAAYGDYKAAHDIDIWANSVSSTGERIIRPDQDWRDYWLLYREANVASQIAYRRSGREWSSPERPGYGIGLRATVTHLCEFEVPKAKQLLAALPDDKRGHSLHSLHAAAQDGWTAELLVARSVLTLWALLAVVPILGGTVDPTTSSTMAVTPMEQQFQLWPAEYSQHVLANPEARVPRLGS